MEHLGLLSIFTYEYNASPQFITLLNLLFFVALINCQQTHLIADGSTHWPSLSKVFSQFDDDHSFYLGKYTRLAS